MPIVYHNNKLYIGRSQDSTAIKSVLKIVIHTDTNTYEYTEFAGDGGTKIWTYSSYWLMSFAEITGCTYAPIKLDVDNLCFVKSSEECYYVAYSNAVKWYYVIPSELGTPYMYNIAPSQLTLNKANQLLPGQIGYGPGGVIEGDGSIYRAIPARTYLDGIYGDTNVSNTIYANQTETNYTSIKTAEDRTGLTAENMTVYTMSSAIPKVTGYNIYAVTKNYLIYLSSDSLTLSIYDFATKTKLYDIVVTTAMGANNNPNSRWCKDVGDNAYLVLSSYGSTKQYFISLNKKENIARRIQSRRKAPL